MNDQDYNVEFVEPPPYECDCPVCFDSFKDKVCFQTTCCGNHICSDCATRLRSSLCCSVSLLDLESGADLATSRILDSPFG